jgi:IS1 family transposase
MNQLSNEKRAQIVACLIEGNSLRATARLTGACFNSVLKFVPQIGAACAAYQTKVFRDLKCQHVQCDEIWSFCYAKARNVPTAKAAPSGAGDVWTWTAIDADTKLVPCWLVGPRDASSAYHFMQRLSSRMAHRIQLTTDGLNFYLPAVGEAFGTDVDYAMLVKLYGEPERTEARYSPPQCIGARKAVVTGEPEMEHVSTSFSERHNLTIRMGNRRFTRLTNAFSKKVENHEHAVALTMMHYNFCRIHKTLRVTPAMEAGLTDHVWSLSEVVALLDCAEAKAA